MVRLALAVGVLLIVAAVLLPNTVLAEWRSEIRWLGQAANQVEGWWPGVNVVHVLMFGVLGLLARAAWPALGAGRLLAVLLVFAGLTELLQFWAPGREPRWVDVGYDLLGACAGVWLAAGVQAGWRRLRATNAEDLGRSHQIPGQDP